MRIKQADNNIIQVVLGCNAERGQKFWTWTQAVQYSLKGTRMYLSRVASKSPELQGICTSGTGPGQEIPPFSKSNRRFI